MMRIGEGCLFHSFTTNVYKFHFLESPSGIKVSMTMLLWGRTQCAAVWHTCISGAVPLPLPMLTEG
jgi:hypothetical protein